MEPPGTDAHTTPAGEDRGPAAPLDLSQIAHLADTAVNPFCLIRLDGTVLWAGGSIDELLGVSAEQLIGRNLVEYVAPASLEVALESLAAADDYMASRSSEARSWEGVGPSVALVRADGTTVEVEVAVATPLRTGLPGVVLQLRRAGGAAALEDAVKAMGRATASTSCSCTSCGCSPPSSPRWRWPSPTGARPTTASRSWAPHRASSPRSRPACSTAPPGWRPSRSPTRSSPTPREPCRSRCARSRSTRGSGGSPRSGSGSPDPLSTAPTSACGAATSTAPTCSATSGCGAAPTSSASRSSGRRGAALEWAVTHDGLTGLVNRSVLVAAIEAQAPRDGSTAVLYLDLDDFKPVNDIHGHTLGDRVLAEVATRLRHAVRPTDVVARIGGDEFGVLCPDVEDVSVAQALAERLVAAVSEPMVIHGVDVQVGLSVGIAALVEGDDADLVLARADEALRRAKRAGKARWAVH